MNDAGDKTRGGDDLDVVDVAACGQGGGGGGRGVQGQLSQGSVDGDGAVRGGQVQGGSGGVVRGAHLHPGGVPGQVQGGSILVLQEKGDLKGTSLVDGQFVRLGHGLNLLIGLMYLKQ